MTRHLYRIKTYSSSRPIKRVEVVSETKCFVTISEPAWNGGVSQSRIRKEGSLFDTFAAAQDALATQYRNTAEASRRNAEGAEKKLAEVLALTEEMTHE
jgi:hypothetical protein